MEVMDGGGWGAGQAQAVPGAVVRRAGRVAAGGEVGVETVGALQAEGVVGVAGVQAQPPQRVVVMEDGVVHERGARGWGEGAPPVQGLPLGLGLGCRLPLEVCQALLLLLNDLLPCRDAGARAA